MIKPDGVQRGLVGKVIKRFETRGFKLVALKYVKVMFFKNFKPDALSDRGRSQPSSWGGGPRARKILTQKSFFGVVAPLMGHELNLTGK